MDLTSKRMKESDEERNKEIKNVKQRERERTLRMASPSLWSQNTGWLNTILSWSNKGDARLRVSQQSSSSE